MKKTRYSEEQIVNILKEGEAGISVSELCRKYGMRGGPRNSDSYIRCKIAGLKEGGSQYEQDEKAEVFPGA